MEEKQIDSTTHQKLFFLISQELFLKLLNADSIKLVCLFVSLIKGLCTLAVLYAGHDGQDLHLSDSGSLASPGWTDLGIVSHSSNIKGL